MPSSTLEDLETTRGDVVGAWGRRAFLVALVVLLVAGLAGWLGVRTATAHASEDGWSVTVKHPGAARAGLDVAFTVTVRHDGGLGEQVTLALTGDYLDLYEQQAFHPEPSATSRDDRWLYLTFDAPPEGDTLVVSYDAYVEPAAQQGRSATLAVRTDGRLVAATELRTRVWP